MKLLKFILIFCGLSFCLTTQPKGYLEPGSAWMEVWINTQNEPCMYFKTGYELGKEITIEEKNYLEILDGRGNFAGGIREEEGKLYAWLFLHGEDATDFLLCDFTAEVGDIVESNCSQGMLKYPFKIIQTDSISLLNGEKRKRLFTDKGTEWIEGIGSTRGIINEAISFSTGMGTSYLTHCYQNEQTLLYINNESYPRCQNDDYKEFINNSNIHLYPNPTTGAVNFSLPVGLSCSSVKIYSQEGKLIQNFPIKADSPEVSLDVSHLQPGIYYLKLESKGLKQTYKIVKL